MPPLRGGRTSPPVDPFPPLRRAGSSSSSSTPSYASIAARSSHSHRQVSHEENSRQGAWGSEDVDRQGNLDDLSTHSHIAYAEPIDINPSPPWRSRARRRSDQTTNETGARPAQTTAQVRSNQSSSNLNTATTPSGSASARTNAIANGARNPADSVVGVSTPPSIPIRPSDHSPPSPSPTRPPRDQPSPAPRLAPMFTLEELLRTNPDQTAAVSSTANSTRDRSSIRTMDVTIRREQPDQRRHEIERATNASPYGMRMERALPSAAGGGNSSSRNPRRSALAAALSTLEYAPDPVVISFPPDNGGTSSRTINRSSDTPVDGSGSGSGSNNANPDASQSSLSYLRRRTRTPAPVPSFAPAWDPEEVLPAEYFSRSILPPTNDLELEDDEEEIDSDEERWASRLRIRNFSDENLSDQVAGSQSLHRGGNNRRRRSFLERIGAPPDLRFPEEFEQRMDFPPPVRGPHEATGCEPTNRDLAERIAPLVVRSGGVIGPRDEPKSSSPIRKRQRTLTSDDEAPTVSCRPSYLDMSTLPKDAILPSDFIPPLRRSHLALSTYKAGDTVRPLITFVGCNPKRLDDDATSLHTTIPIPIECGVHYYEVEVIDKGEEGFMSVGWMKKGTNLRRLVGWDKGSWGWHGDDGRSFEGQGRGERFSETWTTGDVVGCGIDFTTGRAFFTKNGKMMGHRFSKMATGLHPAIGLRSVGESLSVNFDGPFKYDIASYVESTKNGIWAIVKNTEVEEIPRLVDQVGSPVSSNDTKTNDDAKGAITSQKGNGNAKFALAKALEKELKEIEVEEPPTSRSTSASAASITSDPADKASSAFVLDYLRHNGHSKALSSLQNAMIKRGRLNGSSKAPLGEPAELPNKSRASEIGLSDFNHSKYEAIVWIHDVVSASFEYPFPVKLIEDLTSMPLPIPVRASIEIYKFLHLLYRSSLSESTDHQLEQVLEQGRSIRSDMVAWDKEDTVIAEKAFGLLGSPEGLNDSFWIGKRRQWADGLVRFSRDVNRLNQVSQLEHAIRQTSIVMKTLSERNGKFGAAFIDVNRIFE
ncbi:uncharacterized protein I303_100281 [Kwoniella dejecticola CBS 10117]|uniref:B30.2/SPRY domain-containing protein n=1 Tax=Kwoniella dejecticola CBS 10117 TaxID=1296121 RepID=A0A1A6AEH4_9TREE|nr:uncharacterized protein I303_00282 [Kwoniella dejecticola CBS 10117]OBR88465.1 hypothetical protein I303_00282 [Kwoniella dejecticola CBS 10117]